MSEVELIHIYWFLAGILVATFFSSSTAIFLVLVYLLVKNDPMPSYLGQVRPQTILFNILFQAMKLKDLLLKSPELPDYNPTLQAAPASVPAQRSPLNLNLAAEYVKSR